MLKTVMSIIKTLRTRSKMCSCLTKFRKKFAVKKLQLRARCPAYFLAYDRFTMPLDFATCFEVTDYRLFEVLPP